MSKIYKPLSVSVLALSLCSTLTVSAKAELAVEVAKVMQQNSKAKGTVSDVMGPVIGASVVVKGTTNGTITDFDGNFEIPNVEPGSTLVVSYIG